MPRAIDTELVITIVLDSDSDKPESERPSFQYKPLDGREWLKIATLDEQITEAKKATEYFPFIYEQVAIKLIGWKNMGRPFNKDNLDLESILDPIEAQELHEKRMKSLQVSVDDKKKSE